MPIFHAQYFLPLLVKCENSPSLVLRMPTSTNRHTYLIHQGAKILLLALISPFVFSFLLSLLWNEFRRRIQLSNPLNQLCSMLLPNPLKKRVIFSPRKTVIIYFYSISPENWVFIEQWKRTFNFSLIFFKGNKKLAVMPTSECTTFSPHRYSNSGILAKTTTTTADLLTEVHWEIVVHLIKHADLSSHRTSEGEEIWEGQIRCHPGLHPPFMGREKREIAFKRFFPLGKLLNTK